MCKVFTSHLRDSTGVTAFEATEKFFAAKTLFLLQAVMEQALKPEITLGRPP
jgi:hypothetical protein